MARNSQLGLPLLGAITFVVFAVGLLVTNGRNLPGMLQTLSDRSTSCMFVSVLDGDTIRCGFERVRLADIKAPELPGSPDCMGFHASRSWCDHELAYRSKEALEAFLDTGKIEIFRSGEDGSGQTIAIVKVDGVSAGEHLIAQKLAKPRG